MLNIDGFIDTLSIMGYGMGGIFSVILIIYLLVLLFNKLFPGK